MARGLGREIRPYRLLQDQGRHEGLGVTLHHGADGGHVPRQECVEPEVVTEVRQILSVVV